MPSTLPNELELRLTTCTIAGETLLVLSHPADHGGAFELSGPEVADPIAALPRAQREVLELVMEGHSQQAIAESRGTSRRTVAKQIELAYRRLGIGSRLELARLWARAAASENARPDVPHQR